MLKRHLCEGGGSSAHEIKEKYLQDRLWKSEGKEPLRKEQLVLNLKTFAERNTFPYFRVADISRKTLKIQGFETYVSKFYAIMGTGFFLT